jgi:hypothetical protein
VALLGQQIWKRKAPTTDIEAHLVYLFRCSDACLHGATATPAIQVKISALFQGGNRSRFNPIRRPESTVPFMSSNPTAEILLVLFFFFSLQQHKFSQHQSIPSTRCWRTPIYDISRCKRRSCRKFEATKSFRALNGSHRKSAHRHVEKLDINSGAIGRIEEEKLGSPVIALDPEYFVSLFPVMVDIEDETKSRVLCDLDP